jgi:diguanylate cyclase (GGDEF)-like protein
MVTEALFQSRISAPDQEPPALTSAPPVLRTLKHNNPSRVLLLMVPLLYALVGWSLGGKYVVDAETQQTVEVAGILLAGVVGAMLTSYVRWRGMRIERAYSTHLEELSQRLRSLAYRDSLTDLYNHRYFHEQLGHEVERANRYGRAISVILMDLDHFKEVNDTYGHLVGDKLLAFIGQVISNQVRGADIAARYGGDEFAILLPDTPRDQAEVTARKLAKAISASRTYIGLLGTGVPLSASFGVATCPDEARTVSELLQLADDRLYAAKDGRLIAQGQVIAPTGTK